MLGGMIKTPSSITFPANVRIIGAINIDETTHYLSPKILDRAHVMKFDSPLLHDWISIGEEVSSYGFDDVSKSLRFDIDDLGIRRPYPAFKTSDDFCKLMVGLTKQYFTPLGVEVGLRTIRQGLNYVESFLEFNSNTDLAINNFMIHKIFPKLTFDGTKMIGDLEKMDLLLRFQSQMSAEVIKGEIKNTEGKVAAFELEELISKTKSNDGIVNYWA
jgi:hypothetical protein